MTRPNDGEPWVPRCKYCRTPADVSHNSNIGRIGGYVCGSENCQECAEEESRERWEEEFDARNQDEGWGYHE